MKTAIVIFISSYATIVAILLLGVDPQNKSLESFALISNHEKDSSVRRHLSSLRPPDSNPMQYEKKLSSPVEELQTEAGLNNLFGFNQNSSNKKPNNYQELKTVSEFAEKEIRLKLESPPLNLWDEFKIGIVQGLPVAVIISFFGLIFRYSSSDLSTHLNFKSKLNFYFYKSDTTFDSKNNVVVTKKVINFPFYKSEGISQKKIA